MKSFCSPGKDSASTGITAATATKMVNGQSWIVRTVTQPLSGVGNGKEMVTTQFACSQAPVNGQYLEADIGTGSAQDAQVGGITGILDHLTALPSGDLTNTRVR